ncbi:hypothetical protein Q1695_001951 [Nippostrongylus brasiliensis]|nr:hypothetical protein Q1695_001951 [Nippostrongylus brasiliensis]
MLAFCTELLGSKEEALVRDALFEEKMSNSEFNLQSNCHWKTSEESRNWPDFVYPGGKRPVPAAQMGVGMWGRPLAGRPHADLPTAAVRRPGSDLDFDPTRLLTTS